MPYIKSIGMIVLGVVLVIGFVAFLRYSSVKSKIKGKIGESAVDIKLGRLSSEYHVYADIMLSTNAGTTQIDHVVISPYGIFVIEVKNYKGIISGGENSEAWTQNIYGNKYDLRNPIRQNLAHIIALKDVFKGLPRTPFFNIVVFFNAAELFVSSENASVLYIDQLLRTIRNQKTVMLGDDEVDKYCLALETANITDSKVRKNHTNSVKSHIQQRNFAVANGICPRCGGNLVLRDGRYGRFLGCSNYPHCKFTKKLSK